MNVSVAVQASLLAELVEFWGLEAPVVAGHDIGGGIVFRAHLLGGIEFSRISLIDAVVLRPWIPPTTRLSRRTWMFTGRCRPARSRPVSSGTCVPLRTTLWTSRPSWSTWSNGAGR